MKKSRRLQRIYDSIPDVGCKGLCQECCGPMACTEFEAARIEQVTGKPFPSASRCDSCPFLKDSRCSIYKHRPVICRLWGAIPAMRCPFGCKPTLSDREGKRVLLEVQKLSGEGATNTVHTHPHLTKVFEQAVEVSRELKLSRHERESLTALMIDEVVHQGEGA